MNLRFQRWSVSAIATGLAICGSAHAEGISTKSAMTPDLGVNFLGFYGISTHRESPLSDGFQDGLNFQEAEVQFAADVDPYFKASALFAIAAEDGEFAMEPEEVFFESTSLRGVTVRAGKFKAAITRHNEMHTHAYPFIDAPLIEGKLLGEEGLNDAGVSAAALLPTPWFSEVTLQAFAPSNPASFGSTHPGDGIGVARLKNLWDLTEDSTLEWNIAGAAGANAWGRQTWIGTSSLTFKWRPSTMGKYQAFILHGEVLSGHRVGIEENPVMDGVAAWVQYQFAQRWWLQARGEWIGVPVALSNGTAERKQSLLLSFAPSEFSGFRAQYDHVGGTGLAREDHRFALQWNISFGAHPAHQY